MNLMKISLRLPPPIRRQKMHDDEDEVLSDREKTAHRAARAAVFGLLFWPLEAYAAWLLLKVYFSQEKLEGRARIHAKLSAWINVPVILFLGLAVWMFLRGPMEPGVDLRALPHPDVLVGKWEGVLQGKPVETRLFIQLQSVGTIYYGESGAGDIECKGTWAYKDYALLVCYDNYLKGDSRLKGRILRYDVEAFTESEMFLSLQAGKVRMVRAK
jgi:hypothetical protein